MATWTKFLAILGFIGLGFMVLGGVALGVAVGTAATNQLGPIGSIGGIGIALLYILIAGIVFYPAYTLMKYSTGINVAVHTNNKQKFNEAIANLKNTFKFYGIITIISLLISGLFMFVMLSGAMK